MRTLSLLIPLTLLLPGSAAHAADVADLPDGFSEKIVAAGINAATAMAVAPDGRVFVCEQTGALRLVKDDHLLVRPFVTVKVDSAWERGLLGVALHPDFPKTPYVYLCYVSPRPFTHHVISRFTARGDVAVPGSEVVLLEGDDQSRLGGHKPDGHQGGAVHFGKDGKLYIGIGDQTAGAPAQRLDTFQGKLLRINPDGTIPEDNPFYRRTKGKYRAIWAYGLRNPFAFAVQPKTGRIFINDVGEARWEEIDEGIAGANYGWPHSEGPTTDPKYRAPLHAYDRSQGRSITGGAFYDPLKPQFPAAYVGKYFFADYMDNWIRWLDPDNPREVHVFATGLAGPVDLQVGPDGSFYYLNRNAWVRDDKFRSHTGSLHRIQYTARSTRPAPLIIAQSSDQTVAAGEQATFHVTAKSPRPIAYRWRRNGKDIPGASSADLTLSRTSDADSGTRFRCVVSNADGTTKTRPAALWVVRLRSPFAGVRPLLHGLDWSNFEGRWDADLPDFGALRSVKSGSAASVNLDERSRDEHFGLRWQGLFQAERDGAYTFWIRASGAAKVFVAGTEVATSRAGRETSGVVGLKAGKHPISLRFAHRSGTPGFALTYAGPGISRRPIPAALLFRPDPAKPAAPVIRPAGGTIASKAPYGLAYREPAVTLTVPADPADLPGMLSQTGVFASLADLTPSKGVVPYDVITPLWSDGADKKRWIALPGDSRIDFRSTGEWRFPAGTVLIKHFEMRAAPGRPPRRLETRLLVVDRKGAGYGATYRWRADQRDAELLAGGMSEEIALGSRTFRWDYPSRNDCLVCHTVNAGFVLGVKARQLNREFAYPGSGVTDNQLRTWNHLGLFADAPSEAEILRGPRLVALADRSASLEQRVRSYLDANCAHCHRPGGSRGEFDLRFDIPLSRQKILNGELVNGDLGVAGAQLIRPGEPQRSMIALRMKRRHDVFAMPPLASRQEDTEALAALVEWIRKLPAGTLPNR